MLEVDGILVSSEVLDEKFVCDLSACKGACCVEGDLGAPLAREETEILKREYPNIEPYLSEAGKAVIEAQGTSVLDWEGEYSTPTIGNRECAYAIYDQQGILKCGIEQAWKGGRTDYQKPVSCHLYPVRVLRLTEGEALNYDRWSICDAARVCGKNLKVPVYKFTKDALIRAYGAEWYAKLEEAAEESEEE